MIPITVPTDPGPIHQLSLSGGGFRAAFFHLGALHALAAQGRLRELKMLVTISGGSIAAGFFFQEWLAAARKGAVSDDELAQCALRAQQALFRKSRHNPRLRALASVRALSSGLVRNEFGFSQAMARINRRWLGGLHKVASTGLWPAPLPEWRIACSDYAHGNRCVVVLGDKALPRQTDASYLTMKDLPIARAMASSSAVPGVFEPIRCGKHHLGDGGVLDNHGLREFDPSLGHATCIDASAPVLPMDPIDGWATPMRAMDLMMEQTRGDVLRARNCTLISLRDPVAQPSGLDWWTHLRALRTDLDDFAATEAHLLFLAGYQSAIGRPDIPTGCPPDMTALWRTMSEAAATELPKEQAQHLADARDACLDDLERGRHVLFAGMQKRSAASVMVTLGSLFMLSLTVVILFVLARLAWGFTIGHFPHAWRAMSSNALLVLGWAAGAAWLYWQFYTPRAGALFHNMRQWFGVLTGPLVLPALVTLSIALRLKVVAFSNRDLTAWARSALLRYERRRQMAALQREAQRAAQAAAQVPQTSATRQPLE
ncbi:patatin-like phospholipase family protein [Piscinibacter sp. HJYY11]|uniref:patatin-like phospholipase family protein n=1 Tax=Piscinibacter sp. HJYY11 TaxID=2801333 RepID=UPI00191FFEF4|nr:patatin-like phospholipase family protein [Piscinibacter sp. HJYY11]MBL0728859.1 patatin-like phospholipase family protein [Piscinibacter sp. HJYY11]